MFDYRDTTLNNGLRVITLEDFSCPIVAVQLWYRVGSKDEQPDRQGFAHMFEHMMFRGTDRLGPTDHFDYVRRSGGTCNAYTSFDQTVCHEVLPAAQLELALWLEAERMAFLKIDQEAFDTERKVVEEERRKGKNQPYGTALEQVLAETFTTHPYRWSPIGRIPHLRAAGVQELRDFWTRYYVPSNATLVLVGAVTHDQARKQAQHYFGWIPSYANPRREIPVEAAPSAKSAVIKEKNAPAPATGVLFRTAPSENNDQLALELLATILGTGNSSRIYRSLVADKRLAVEAMAMSYALEQDGFFGVGAVMSPIGPKIEETQAALQTELARLRSEPVSEAELTKARNQMLKGLVATNLTIDSKASLLGSAAVLDHDLKSVNRIIDEVQALRATDLQAAAQTYLDPNRALTLTINSSIKSMLKDKVAGFLGLRPSGDEEKNAPIMAQPETEAPAPGRPGVTRPADYPQSPPLAGGTPQNVMPAHQRHRLANGLKIVVVPNREVSFVTVQLGMLAGAWTERKPGTAPMALRLLTKGTSEHREQALAEALETYAISLSGRAGMDTSRVQASCLTDQLDRTMTLMAEVTLHPTFPSAEFDLQRTRTRTSLEVDAASPAYKASRELRTRLFGVHPYARAVSGEPADLDQLTVDDCRQWWSTFARPDMAVLIFAGDITLERATALANDHFGAWQAAGLKPDTTLPTLARPESTQIYLVDNPTVTQCEIRFGQLGFTRHHPNYALSRVVSSYFGGAFNSRLNKSLRVDKGLTYGARGGFSARRFQGQFTISTFSKNATTATAVKAILGEIARLQQEPPSAKELSDTQSYFAGTFLRQHETPQQLAGELWMMEVNDLRPDFLEQLLKGIAAADAEACTRLAQTEIDQDRLVIVVVGPAPELKESLQEIAPVTVVSEAKNPSG